MDSDAPHRKPKITVIDILVWIAVITVLCGFLLPVPGGARNASGKASAKNDETQLAHAIDQFYIEYGYYPCATNPDGDSRDFFANGGAKLTELMDLLRANNQTPMNFVNDSNPNFVRTVKGHAPDITTVNKLNFRQIIFLDEPFVKDPIHPKSGIGPDGAWYDPWGHPYLVKIDSNDNGSILNPYDKNAGPKEITAGAIVWSLGPDGKGAVLPTGNGDKNASDDSDDVTSWQ